MTLYRKLPVAVEAVQFTGENWAEMHDFCGHVRINDITGDVFRDYGSNAEGHLNVLDGKIANLWVAANQAWLPIEVGEWVLKDELGFYPCKDSQFKKIYVEDSEIEIMFKGMEDISVPLLEHTDSDSKFLGRIYMALLMTRPGIEATMIIDRIMGWNAKVRLAGDEFHDEGTMDKAHSAIEDGLNDWASGRENPHFGATQIISGLQNAGIKFREVRSTDLYRDIADN